MKLFATPILPLAFAALVVPAMSQARDWGQDARLAEGGCYAAVEGQVLVDYDCTILLYSGGDFEVSQMNGRVFVGVEVTGDGVGRVHYREHEGETEALGTVRREKFDPACWAGEMARVCAR